MGIFYGAQNYKFTTRYEIARQIDWLKILLKMLNKAGLLLLPYGKGSLFL